jgi:hypothetical protein
MDIFSALKEDHEKIKAILRKLGETTENAIHIREREFANLHEELTSHSRAEEEVFYKRLENAQETRALVLEGEQEHHLVDELIDEMAELDLDDDHWAAKLSLLREHLEHHIKQEERKLFEQAGKVLKEEECRHLGKAFRRDKQSWKT